MSEADGVTDLPDVLDEEPTIRERIFAAALECFTQNGVRRTSMEDVAHQAGVSRPTIYYYFENKRALTVEAVLRQQAASHRRQSEQLAGHRGLDAVVESVLLGVELASSDPFSTLLTRPENERLTADALRSPAARELQEAFWGPLLADARRRNELRTDVGDEDIISWILFIQFALVTTGNLFGVTDRKSTRRVLDSFLTPALRAGIHTAS